MQCDILRYGTFHLCNFNSVHMGKVFWLGVFSKADQSGFVSKSEFVTSAGYIYFLNMSSWIFNRLISFLVNFIGRLSITCDPSLRQEGPMVVLQGQSVNILWRIGPPTSSDLSLWCPFCSQTVGWVYRLSLYVKVFPQRVLCKVTLMYAKVQLCGYTMHLISCLETSCGRRYDSSKL